MTDTARVANLLRDAAEFFEYINACPDAMPLGFRDEAKKRAFVIRDALDALSDEGEEWTVERISNAYEFVGGFDLRTPEGTKVGIIYCEDDARTHTRDLNRLPRLERAAREVTRTFSADVSHVTIAQRNAIELVFAIIDEEPSR